MAPRGVFAQWRATDGDVDEAVQSTRRRDLGWWRDQPVWMENSGPDRSQRLVTVRDGDVRALATSDLPIGSRLYDYGAPGWTALSAERLLVLRSDAVAVVELLATGEWGTTTALGEGRSAGYLRTVDPERFVVLVDLGPSRGRQIQLWNINGNHHVVYETPNLLSDLVIDGEGLRLAWIEWAVGTMPWDTANLNVLMLDAASSTSRRVTDRGAAAQPQWVGRRLWFDWEVAEWSTPHYVDFDRDDSRVVSIDAPHAEFRPDWTFGRSWRAATSEGLFVASVFHSRACFGIVDGHDTYVALDGVPTYVYEVSSSAERTVVLGSTTSQSCVLWEFDAKSREWHELAASGSPRVSSARQRVSAEGVPFVWWYPSNVVDHDSGPASGDRPGLVVLIHGGPTAYASLEFSWLVELFCRSGFAVACVDYRGSTSYGRSYRHAINGQWGSADVDDVTAVVRELVASGDVASERVYVRGTSAGALTALLVSRVPLIRGVVSVAGVTDARRLAEQADELERDYVAQLVGGTPQDQSSLYATRSPREQLDALADQILVVHGTADVVVPIDQTREFVAALRSAGRDVDFLEFEGEGHGIRHPENAKRAYRAELAFYTR